MKSPLILLLVLLLASVWSPTLLAEESAPIDFVGIYRIGETARVLLRAPSDSAWLTIGQSMGRIQLVGISEDFKSVEVKIGEQIEVLNLVSARDTPLEVVTVTETEIPLTERLNSENIASLEQARVDLLAQGLPPPVVEAMVLQIANDMLAMDAFFRSVPEKTMAQADWGRLAEEQAARGNLFLWTEDENGDLLRSQLVRWPIRPQMDPETGQVTLVPASESEAHEQFALQIEAFNAGSSPVAPISRAVPQP